MAHGGGRGGSAEAGPARTRAERRLLEGPAECIDRPMIIGVDVGVGVPPAAAPATARLAALPRSRPVSLPRSSMYRPGRDGGAGAGPVFVAAAAAAGPPSPILVRWPAAGGGAAVAKVISSVATGASLIGTGAPEGTAPAALHLGPMLWI